MSSGSSYCFTGLTAQHCVWWSPFHLSCLRTTMHSLLAFCNGRGCMQICHLCAPSSTLLVHTDLALLQLHIIVCTGQQPGKRWCTGTSQYIVQQVASAATVTCLLCNQHHASTAALTCYDHCILQHLNSNIQSELMHCLR